MVIQMSDLINKLTIEQDWPGMLRRALQRIIQLYTDKSHFVYELLQNAEDAKAKNVKFVQYDDRLEVFHNGKPFTLSNLQGLCDIGKSDKIEELNQIGEFGVGFKSVFSICDTVKLFSDPSHFRDQSIVGDAGPFSIEILDFVKPKDIDNEVIDGDYTTRFVFPYCVGEPFSGYKTISTLTSDLSKKIQNLGITTLLFMRNLELIEYEIKLNGDTIKGEYLLGKKVINEHCTLVSALGTATSELKKSDKEEEVSYLKFSRNIDNISLRTVDIAFPITVDSKGNYTCVHAANPHISVYFPTETESKLGFIVQGPFRTTPDRAKIPVDDEDNKRFVEELAILLRESILELRDAGKLNLSFIKNLPLMMKDYYGEGDTSINMLFLPLYNTVFKLFVGNNIIKSLNGKYVKSTNAKLARSKDLTEVFSDEQLTLLINNGVEYYWLPVELTETNREFKNLYDFLSSRLRIQVVSPESLKPWIDKNEFFFKAMSDNWLVSFYKFLSNVPSAVLSSKDSGLRISTIIKTSDNTFVAAYRKEGGQYIPNVFLPTKGFAHPGINFIDENIYKQSREFFDNVLHLQQPDEYEFFIQDIRLRYETDTFNQEEHIQDVKFLIKYIVSNEQGVKDVIRDCFKFRCDDGVMRNIYESSIYMPESSKGIKIKEYFKNISVNKFFVDLEYYFNNDIAIESLCKLGIIDSITKGEMTGSHFFDSYWREFTIEKIGEALKHISNHPNSENSKIKSQVIMNILFANGSNLSCDYANVCELIKYLRGEKDFSWDRRWVYTNNGELVSTYSISKYDLDEKLYGPVKSDSTVYKLLGFIKTDADKADELRNQVSAAVLESYFFDELKKRYNITPERLQEIIDVNDDIGKGEEKDEEEFFEFPTLPVKNIDALKKHVAEVLTFADPVKYSLVVRSIRTSSRQADARAYVRSIYRYVGAYKFACQMCHKPSSDIEAVQIFPNPKTELDQIHLCLCPNCAAKYRKLITSDSNVELLKDVFLNKKIGGKEFSDKIVVSVGEYELWFTQTHFAEVQELLRLMGSANTQKPTDEIVIDEESGEESGLSVYQGYLGKIFKKKSRRNKGYDYIGKVIKVDTEFIYLEISERLGKKTKEEMKLSLGFNEDSFDIVDE